MYDAVLSLCLEHATTPPSLNALLPSRSTPVGSWLTFPLHPNHQGVYASIYRTSEQVRLTPALREWLALGDRGGGCLALAGDRSGASRCWWFLELGAGILPTCENSPDCTLMTQAAVCVLCQLGPHDASSRKPWGIASLRVNPEPLLSIFHLVQPALLCLLL